MFLRVIQKWVSNEHVLPYLSQILGPSMSALSGDSSPGFQAQIFYSTCFVWHVCIALSKRTGTGYYFPPEHQAGGVFLVYTVL